MYHSHTAYSHFYSVKITITDYNRESIFKATGIAIMNIKKLVFIIIPTFAGALVSASHASDLENYCRKKGGVPVIRQAQIDTHTGFVNGLDHKFCEFHVNKTLAIIGLKTFASELPSIAATYTKKLPPIGVIKNTKYANPSLDVCERLHGSSISLGGFAGKFGQADICVFGDGSMISGWTLIYSTRSPYPKYGYSFVKENIRSKAMAIDMPPLPPFNPDYLKLKAQ